MRNYQTKTNGPVIQIHIADIHFGSVDPIKEYQILKEQFLDRIYNMNFHILAIDGDLFHKKYMANSEPIYYASLFIDQCVNICRMKNATLLIISGTESHDAGQLRLFEHYSHDETIDVRIVERLGFEYIYGLKILCIPEEHNKKEDYYFEYLSQDYDCCFMHGTIVGSIFGAKEPDLNSAKFPIFDINSFSSCKGPIICGHVHKAMCLKGYMYYVSNPIRFAHNEEEEKGFGIVLMDPISKSHYYNFIPIHSFIYRTIGISSIAISDPNAIIEYMNSLRERENVDYLRIDCSGMTREFLYTQRLLEQYYASDNTVSIKGVDISTDKKQQEINTTEEVSQKYDAISKVILDPTLDEFTKMVYFINYNEGSEFISIENFKEMLKK